LTSSEGGFIGHRALLECTPTSHTSNLNRYLIRQALFVKHLINVNHSRAIGVTYFLKGPSFNFITHPQSSAIKSLLCIFNDPQIIFLEKFSNNGRFRVDRQKSRSGHRERSTRWRSPKEVIQFLMDRFSCEKKTIKETELSK